MKCDIVIYSDSTAIGLFYFAKWGHGSPCVMFVYETEKTLQDIKTLGEYCVKDDNLALKIKEHHHAGDLLSETLMPPLVKIYRAFLKEISVPESEYINYFRTRKIIYTDLIKCCQPEMARYIIENLKNSKDKDENIQALECERILNSKGVRLL